MADETLDVALANYLMRQRWFGGKGRTLTAAHILEQTTVPSHSERVYRLAIVEVKYVEEPAPERYLLAIAEDTAGQFREALDDDPFAWALLDLIRARGELAIGSTVIRGELFPNAGTELAHVSERPHIRRLGVEQSNTSLVFDDAVILKLVRKIEAGLNPEYEVGSFLSGKNLGCVPPLVGALQLEGPMGTAIAVLHRFIPRATDGWEYTLQQLAQGAPKPRFLEEVRKLGERLAKVHLALADSEEPAFAPEPLLEEDFQRWSASIIGELSVTLMMAEKVRPELESIHESLRVRLRALAKVQPSGMEQRIHGDLHLGQVLFTNGDWMIFDFEGEPARTFQQRREKHSPLKDVAGMLRSFAYAEAMARQRNGASEGRSIVGPLRASFLEGYKSVMGDSHLLPRGETFDVLLEAMELEKLLYELRYEIQNRPDWIRIPADDLKALENAPR